MNPENCEKQAREKKLSEEYTEFIDLSDEDLEEVDVLEFGGVHGGRCGCGGCFHRCGCGGCFRCGCGGCGACSGGCCF